MTAVGLIAGVGHLALFFGGIPVGAVQLVAMLLAFGPLTFVLLRRK